MILTPTARESPDPKVSLGLPFLGHEHVWRLGAMTCAELCPMSTAVWDALSIGQHADLKDWTPAPEPSLVTFRGPGDPFDHALRTLMGKLEQLPRGAVIPEHETATHEARFAEALELFKHLLPSEFLGFKSLIAAVILARREGFGGASVSSRIGLIWLSPTAQWSAYTWLENLVHEYIHNCLFLEDMVYCLFPDGADRLAKADALSVSAIRQERRGYDKSFHSAFVAAGLAALYKTLGDDLRASQLVSPALICVSDLISFGKLRFTTQRGVELLEGLSRVLVELYGAQRINSERSKRAV